MITSDGTLYVTCIGAQQPTLLKLLGHLYPSILVSCHEADEQAMFALDGSEPTDIEITTLRRAVQQAHLTPVTWYWFAREDANVIVEEGDWHVLT